MQKLREVASLVSSIMIANGNQDQVERKYWYPLAIPTYGPEEVLEAIDSMVSFRTSMWDKTKLFEREFGRMFGGEAVMVNSGSSADLLIAFGLHKSSGGMLQTGDQVLIPAVTWPTQLWSALMAGYRVKLVDVDPSTLNVDIDALEASISPATRAISLVHLMGNPVNMNAVGALVDRHQLTIFEDCCESLGAKWEGDFVGTFGEASSFSFFFSHHITTMEGGMILTRNAEFAERLRLLRAHGWSRNLHNPPPPSPGIDPRYTFLNWGFNVRPTELQAGFGVEQLKKVESFQDQRNVNAAIAQERLSGYAGIIDLMEVSPGGVCSWFALPMLIADKAGFTRDQLATYLEGCGVETRPIVTGNLARHPAVQRFQDEIEVGDLPGADTVHENGLYVGLHPIPSASALHRLFDHMDDFVAPYL